MIAITILVILPPIAGMEASRARYQRRFRIGKVGARFRRTDAHAGITRLVLWFMSSRYATPSAPQSNAIGITPSSKTGLRNCAVISNCCAARHGRRASQISARRLPSVSDKDLWGRLQPGTIADSERCPNIRAKKCMIVSYGCVVVYVLTNGLGIAEPLVGVTAPHVPSKEL